MPKFKKGDKVLPPTSKPPESLSTLLDFFEANGMKDFYEINSVLDDEIYINGYCFKESDLELYIEPGQIMEAEFEKSLPEHQLLQMAMAPTFRVMLDEKIAWMIIASIRIIDKKGDQMQLSDIAKIKADADAKFDKA